MRWLWVIVVVAGCKPKHGAPAASQLAPPAPDAAAQVVASADAAPPDAAIDAPAPVSAAVDPATLAAPPGDPPAACPELLDSWWAEEIAPTCAPQPFASELPHKICAGPCPRPCRIVATEAGASTTSTVTYDANGRWLSTSGPTVSEACTYDVAGRSSCTRGVNTPTTVKRVKGRVTEIVEHDDRLVYKYDRPGRVISVTSTTLRETTKFTYDKAGRLAGEVPDKKLGDMDNTAYEYDAEGQLAKVTAGPVFSRYTWTNKRLVEVVDRVSGMPGSTKKTIAYDAAGRPHSITTDEDSDKGPRVATFVYDCK